MTRDSPSAIQQAAAETSGALALRVQHVVFRSIAAAAGMTPQIKGGKFTVTLKTGKKNPPQIEIHIVNPEDAVRPDLLQPRGPYTPDLVHNMLALVGVDIPAEDLKPLAPLELALAFDWASREHLRAADNLTRSRPRPHVLTILEDRQKRRATRKPGKSVAAEPSP